MNNISTNSLIRPANNPICRLFLSDKFIMSVILINAVIIFIQLYNINLLFISILDLVCTFVFIIEMCLKHYHLGFKNYWKSGLNAMDGTLVILSLPSVLALFYPELITDISFLLALRTFRVFRFFRLIHLFPSFPTIANNFMLAMKQSSAVILCLLLIIVIFALIGCSLFGESTPEFFGTPLDGIYSTFRLFTIEGWYDIPDTVAQNMNGAIWGHFVRIYFCILLFIGGIIGMSLINSIFVDAMVSDNNDDVKEQLDKIETKLNCLESIESQTQTIENLKTQIAELTKMLQNVQNSSNHRDSDS